MVAPVAAFVPAGHSTEPRAPAGPETGVRAFGAVLARQVADASGPTVVRAVRTPLSGSQAADAIGAAWAAEQGAPAAPATVAVLTAQWAHETGRGASMLNFNFGGIKGASPEGATVEARTREGWGPSERTIVDRFRAYESAEQGAADYLRLLSRRYPEAVEAARQGDAAGFVRALKARGYFTGNEAAYTAAVARMTESALASGFDALGATAGAVARPLVETGARYGAHAWAGPSASPGAVSFVGAEAIADEVGRAALRIAATESRDQRERWP